MRHTDKQTLHDNINSNNIERFHNYTIILFQNIHIIPCLRHHTIYNLHISQLEQEQIAPFHLVKSDLKVFRLDTHFI